MKKPCFRLLFSLLLLSALFFSCQSPTPPSPEMQTVVDTHGRVVSVPKDIKRVACIGSGALRLYSYIGDLSLLCGVEECERGFLISARPYQMANEALFRSLPSIGTGGPQGTPNAEALLAADPDVIFSLYTTDDAAMNELQEKTGIPVIILDYGDTEAFNDTLLDSIRLMGAILGEQTRAGMVVGYLQSIQVDLQARTKQIADEDKPLVYLGCQSNYGTHGIGSTTANYSLFEAVGVKNVLDDAGYEGYVKALDYETLLTLDPDIIILDAGGLENLQAEYAARPAFFDALTAFQTGRVYLMLPYNAYYTNLEIAYANAYGIGKVVYPDAFADIDPAEKFDEITDFLLGKTLYEDIKNLIGVGYEVLDLAMLR